MIKLTTLKKGDKVGLISVSSPVKKQVVEKSISYLNDIGLEVECGKNIFSNFGYMAGSPSMRADDLHYMFKNNEIRAIFCANGGTSANQILPILDYELIKQYPKIFVGLSDPCSVAIAINSKTDMVTFHGPTGYNFGESGMTSFTEKYFIKSLMGNKPLGEIIDKVDWNGLKYGEATGGIIGGNMTILQSLIGTPYEPNWEGKILFWEDLFVEFHTIDLILNQFKQAGIFDKISGMIIGELVECQESEYESPESFEEMIERIFHEYNFPILSNVSLGHTDDKITIPMGVEVNLKIDNENINFMFNESSFED